MRDFSPNPIKVIIKAPTSFSFVDDFYELLRLRIETKWLTIREPLHFHRLERKIIALKRILFCRNELVGQLVPDSTQKQKGALWRLRSGEIFIVVWVTNRTTFIISILFLQRKQLPSDVTTTTKGKAPNTKENFHYIARKYFHFTLQPP